MIQSIRLDNIPCTLRIVITASSPTKVWIKVADSKKRLTYYTKRYGFVKDEQTYYVRLPQSPDMANVIVYADGSTPEAQNNNLKIRTLNVLPLTVKPIQISKRTKSFILFAQEFCERCSYLPATPQGESYYSDNGKFKIVYYPEIKSKADGKVVKTPARISQINGRIEVSKTLFMPYSVAMRMAILMHEFSHFYINKNPNSEIESDINGLNIYLALGYPRIDAYNVFCNVFKSSTNTETLKRFETLNNFIKEYEYGK
jgi:hypothetical protein